MKKVAALVAATVAAAAAAPVAAQVNVGGKVETRYELKKVSGQWQLGGKTGVELRTSVTGGNPVRATVELGTLENGFNDDGTLTDAPTANSPYPADQLKITKVRLETEGSLWNGGSVAKATLGDYDVTWNDIVAYAQGRRGIAVENVGVGPVNARAFWLMPKIGGAGKDAQHFAGVGISGQLPGVELGAMMTSLQGSKDLAVNAKASVIPGVGLEGTAALDSANRKAFDVKAKATVIPSVTVTGGYRHADAGFAPAYAKTGDVDVDHNPITDPVSGQPVAYRPGESGFYAGLDATQAGVHLVANYDDPTKSADVKAETSIQGFGLSGQAWLAQWNNQPLQLVQTQLGVTRQVALGGVDLTGGYTMTKRIDLAKAEHKLTASATTSIIPQLQGLKLSGEATVNKIIDAPGGGKTNATDLRWNVAADYATPSGLDLGVTYDSVEAVKVRAGAKVQF